MSDSMATPEASSIEPHERLLRILCHDRGQLPVGVVNSNAHRRGGHILMGVTVLSAGVSPRARGVSTASAAMSCA
jgi:hypothetical protein